MKYLITILISFFIGTYVYAEILIDNQCVNTVSTSGDDMFNEDVAVMFNPRHSNIAGIKASFFTHATTTVLYEIYEGESSYNDATCTNLSDSGGTLLRNHIHHIYHATKIRIC